MNVLLTLHVILTPLVTTQLDRSLVNVIKGTKEMEPTAEVSASFFLRNLGFG